MPITEFAEHMRRRNLDVMFPSEDQDLVYESLRAAQPGTDTPMAGVMLKLVNESDPKYSYQPKDQDMLAMREFLAEAAQTAGVVGGGAHSSDAHQTKEETELMKKAVGQKTFGIDIVPTDMDKLVDDLNKQHHDPNDAASKFSRFLRLTNMKLHAAPFYDMRNDILEERKQHVSRLAAVQSDTLSQLAASKMRESRALDGVLNRSLSLAALRTSAASSSSSSPTPAPSPASGPLSHSQSSPALRSGGLSQYLDLSLDPASDAVAPASGSGRGSGGRGGPLSHRSDSSPSLSPVKFDNTASFPMAALATPISSARRGGGGGGGAGGTRNLAGSLDEAGALDAAAQLSIGGLGVGSLHLNHAAPVERAVGAIPDPTLLQSPSSSSLSSSWGAASIGDFVDQRIRREKPLTPEAHVGKRVVDGARQSTDWHRIGHGGDVLTPRNVKALNANEAEYRGRYHTTNSDYYPPLIYQPSMPITRALVSDADAREEHKKSQRERRHRRKEENLSVTRERLQREELEKESREIKWRQKVNDDMIKFCTTVFVNDLKSFRKQPLQMMMKKPSLTRSDHMWTGTIGREKVSEDRDFNTTYGASFETPSSMGSLHPPIVLEDRVAAIFGKGSA